MSIVAERIIPSDPRLKRHVRHDSRSRMFAFDTRGIDIGSVEHAHLIPILDQGSIGKCTAECALNLLGTAPYYPSATQAYIKKYGSFDDNATNKYYNDEESLDGDGPYPPQDNGSTGLTMAKVARAAECISGWNQTFNLADFLKALQVYPIGCGTYWLASMFDPDGKGNITIDFSSGIRGGHEYACIGYDASTNKLKFVQSWGTSFGDNGYMYMNAAEFGQLLSQRGDATVFIPATQPAPVPAPQNAFDAASLVLDPWSNAAHVGSNKKAAHAWQAYAKAVRA